MIRTSVIKELDPVRHFKNLQLKKVKTSMDIWQVQSMFQFPTDRSSRPEVFLGKDVPKICCKFTGELPCQSAISIKLLCNFIQIALRHGCSFVNLLHILGIPFPKNFSGLQLLTDLATFTEEILNEKLNFYAVKLKHDISTEWV